MRSQWLWVFWSILAVVPASHSILQDYLYFDVNFIQKVNENIEGNVILSPASMRVALTSLLEATGGQTRQELLTVLRLPPEDYIRRQTMRFTLASLKSSQNGTEIGVATHLWASPSLRIPINFASALQRYYDVNVTQINFGDTYSAAQTINNWVCNATRDNIKSIVQPDTLNTDTRLLLTSALYFKGRWLKSFEKQSTRERCFHVPEQGCRLVPMMESAAKYRYANAVPLDAEVVEIPYSDGKTAMLIFLPNHPDRDPYLRTLSMDLSFMSMDRLLSHLSEMDMVLILPRFSIENKLDLRLPLMHMGVHELFNDKANFTNIRKNEFLRVSGVLQNAKISVDEEGTIAAAVTDLTITPLMAVEQNFIVDRPFMFAIVDLSSKDTLFAGRIMDPTETSSGRA